MFTDWKNVRKFHKFVWEFKNCSQSKFCLQILNNVHIYKFCSEFQISFRFQNCLQILKHVCSFKFYFGVSNNIHVQKLFVFPNFVLKFETLFLFNFLAGLKNVFHSKKICPHLQNSFMCWKMFEFSQNLWKKNNVHVW